MMLTFKNTILIKQSFVALAEVTYDRTKLQRTLQSLGNAGRLVKSTIMVYTRGLVRSIGNASLESRPWRKLSKLATELSEGTYRPIHIR